MLDIHEILEILKILEILEIHEIHEILEILEIHEIIEILNTGILVNMYFQPYTYICISLHREIAVLVERYYAQTHRQTLVTFHDVA